MGMMMFDDDVLGEDTLLTAGEIADGDSIETVRLKAVIRVLVAACYEGLQFRGLMTALHDPLMFDAEKKELRERWKNAEMSIRAAIKQADDATRK